MDWDDWHKHYENLPDLQARLRIVGEQIAAALDECPPGPIRIVSLCAGDGRDVIGILRDHPRRHDVHGSLLDNHAPSIARGRAAAEAAGLAGNLRFVEADAAVAKNYADIVPADIVILSGFLGHLRHEDIPGLIASLPMFCRTSGSVIWNRHLIMHGGGEQVPATRRFLRQANFDEVSFQTTGAQGFAVGRSRNRGPVLPLDPDRVLFEFVGIDRLVPAYGELATRDARMSVAEVAEASAADSSHDDQSIVACFEQMVSLYPTRTALGYGAWQPSYAELDAAANRLAQNLIARGALPGDRVALLLRHDSPGIAAALSVLKAAGVVVLLNSTDPPSRLQSILRDAEPRLIVTDAANQELARLIAGPKQALICFEPDGSGPDHRPGVNVAPGDLAWIIYTSGSSGPPKGVTQSHRNIVHNVFRLSRGMEVRFEDRFILLASPSGGQGVSTTWCALLNGATLCPFPLAEKGFSGLIGWMREHPVSVFVSSASVFRQFSKTAGAAARFPPVRLLRLGSESSTASDLAGCRRLFGEDCVLIGTLSSSETGNLTQLRLTKGEYVAEGRLPLGRPVAGIEILLWDERGREVRDGETGEIVVRSRYLSPGYWRNPALTKERFLGGERPEDARLFRSGDLARRLSDGGLMFMDRADTRVKIHGYRVEVSEIENALVRQAEVEDAVICPRPASAGGPRLVAYVVLRPAARSSAETLRRRLSEVLPSYMLPGCFMFLDAFPLTPHGKIDRQALPPPGEKERSRHVAKPRDIVERNLARMWESVLGISPVNRDDDFFDLGGSSLQSIELLAAIEEFFNVALPSSALIEYSTIERLAVLLSDHAFIPSSSSLVTLRRANSGRPLFLVHSGQGDVVTYGLLVRRLRARPVYGLQAAGIQGERWPLMSIPAMADRYLAEIVAADPTGPYLLAGTCMGGMVAFELARRLVRLGRTVNLVALIDSPTPPHSGRRLPWHEAVLDPLRDMVRIFRWRFALSHGRKPDVRQLPSYRRFVAGMAGRAFRRYRPAFYPGTITLLLTADTKYRTADRRPLIADHAQETRKVVIQGTRTGLFVRPAVDELARQLQRCLDATDDVALDTASPASAKRQRVDGCAPAGSI